MTVSVHKGPTVRVAGVLNEEGRLLVVKQEVTATRHWSLPGGHLEVVETIEQCLVREIKEETGLGVALKELLYITDRFANDTHVVHISLLVGRVSRDPLPLTWTHDDPYHSASSARLREIRMVPLADLTKYGFSQVFCELALAGFPGRGYKGSYHTFYGES